MAEALLLPIPGPRSQLLSTSLHPSLPKHTVTHTQDHALNYFLKGLLSQMSRAGIEDLYVTSSFLTCWSLKALLFTFHFAALTVFHPSHWYSPAEFRL